MWRPRDGVNYVGWWVIWGDIFSVPRIAKVTSTNGKHYWGIARAEDDRWGPSRVARSNILCAFATEAAARELHEWLLDKYQHKEKEIRLHCERYTERRKEAIARGQRAQAEAEAQYLAEQIAKEQ